MSTEPCPTREERAAWFVAARFGIFVHWGLYSRAGGVWRGQVAPGLSEWLMHRFRIRPAVGIKAGLMNLRAVVLQPSPQPKTTPSRT